ncbi:MAG: tRNA glutamyl-Q(34) synthetase GluQRS [Polyangiaceae bacterium]
MSYRGRFAPSPTGRLHLGSAATALFAAAAARRAGGRWLLRVEDLDSDRVVPGAEHEQLNDLEYLGLTPDEGPTSGGPTAPYRQSERRPLYEAALEALSDRGLTYYCDCSRADIQRAASAPHAGDEGPLYPGTCRSNGMRPRSFKRPPAVRLRIPDSASQVRYEDSVVGTVCSPTAGLGDFVLRRGDGVFSYQFAVVVDDLAMGITEVVRGRDLMPSAPRQALLAELLGGVAPAYCHVPMLTDASGDRLAKRTPRATVSEHRERGIAGVDVLRVLANAYAQVVSPSMDVDVLGALATVFDPKRFPDHDVPLSDLRWPS